jgi:hypothetical protein
MKVFVEVLLSLRFLSLVHGPANFRARAGGRLSRLYPISATFREELCHSLMIWVHEALKPEGLKAGTLIRGFSFFQLSVAILPLSFCCFTFHHNCYHICIQHDGS